MATRCGFALGCMRSRIGEKEVEENEIVSSPLEEYLLWKCSSIETDSIWNEDLDGNRNARVQ